MFQKSDSIPSEEREISSADLQASIRRIVQRRILSRGEVDFPCVPALLDEYVADLIAMWGAIGKAFSDNERAQLRDAVALALKTGFEATPYARMVVSFEAQPPPHGVRYAIRLKENTIDLHYEHWLSDRKGPLFGALPDAKVLELAERIGPPEKAPVLDIGAGTGRNAIALARVGHPTHALELVSALTVEMKKVQEDERLPLEVIEADVLSPVFVPRRDHYKLVILSEVTPHFRDVEELRAAMTKVADSLVSGGFVVMNAFLARGGYEPDALAHQVSEVSWSRIFTRADLSFITGELPFEEISDESVHDHEKAKRTAAEWPPTTWFVDWSRGRNVFDLPLGRAPVELRWIVYRKK
ncbi:MAG: methyltransferase domain-containing protein [Polyangiaceae bacterium]